MIIIPAIPIVTKPVGPVGARLGFGIAILGELVIGVIVILVSLGEIPVPASGVGEATSCGSLLFKAASVGVGVIGTGFRRNRLSWLRRQTDYIDVCGNCCRQ